MDEHLQEGFSDLKAALKEAQYDSLAILSVFYSVQLRSLASIDLVRLKMRKQTNEKERKMRKESNLIFQVDLPSFNLLIAGLANITQPSSRTQVTTLNVIVMSMSLIAACKV